MQAPVRYRCSSCGNLTRFDVVRTACTSAYYHYSTGGELAIEDEQVLDERIESVTCRWCGPTGVVESIEDATAEAIDEAEG